MPLPRRLLLVKLSALGDIVLTLPLASALRKGLGPEAHIVWAVHQKFAALLEGNPDISSLQTLSDKRLPTVFAFGNALRNQRFDTAIDPQGLFVSGLITALSGAKTRVGLNLNREANKLFLTEASVVGDNFDQHIVDRLMGFCDALGVARQPVQRQTYLAESHAERACELLDNCGVGPRIGCIIGTSTIDKAYPEEQWITVVQSLAERGLRPVLLGGPGEAPSAARISEAVRGAVAGDLCGKTTIRELASVCAQCDVVIGGDTGPTHLAVAVGTPVVGLYGVTDPVRVGPSWGCAPSITLDYVQEEAPRALRKTRHPLVERPLARIPAAAITDAVCTLLGDRS